MSRTFWKQLHKMGQCLKPGDQVCFVHKTPTSVISTRTGYEIKNGDAKLKVGKIVSIEELCPGFAEYDGDYSVTIDCGGGEVFEQDAENVIKTDGNWRR